MPGDVAARGYPPAVLQALDEAAAGRWWRAACVALSKARGRLDDLNVFLVPDGDTGTNLLLTAEAALAALDEAGDEPAESVWTVMARGAVLGARGNSGTILAQLFRGLADQLAGQGPADGPRSPWRCRRPPTLPTPRSPTPRRAPSSPWPAAGRGRRSPRSTRAASTSP